MAVNKIDPKVIFASEAPAQDTPAVFTNRTVGWGETRKNGGRPTIKQMNAEQQSTDLKILWLNENSVTPYDPTIDYPLDAVTIKDGVFKIFDGSVWEVFLDKTDIGLGNVDNTSDLNKPISTATQAALDLKADKSYVDNSLPHNNLINRNSSGAHEAVAILNNNNENQQQINDRGGAIWYSKSGGYNLNDRVILDNGDEVKSTEPSNATNPNVDMTDWVKTNDASQIFDTSGRSQQEINSDYLNLKDYYKLKVGNDWSDALIQAVADGKAQGKSLLIFGGTYDYSKSFTIEIPVIGAGREVTRLRKTAPAEITILKGCLNHITVSPDTLIVGDTTRGVILDGLDRKDVYDLWTEKHGGDGIVYKRGNLSRFVVHSRSNNGRGVTFLRDSISGDNKACEFFIEVTANGLSGVYMDQSPTQVQTTSSHYGAIRAQNNGKINVTDDNYDVVLTGIGHELNIYAEYGAQSVWHRDGLKASRIYYSSMSHPTFRNDASANYSNLISYVSSALGSRTTINENFEMWTVHNENKSYSGRLSLAHVGNNTFRFLATLSGAQQNLEVPVNLTLRGEGNAYQFAKSLTGGATLNFSSVPAQGMVERTVNVTGAVTSLQTACIATPAGNIGNNLTWNYYVSAFDAGANTTTVTVRVSNPTAAAIASTQLAWRVKVFPE